MKKYITMERMFTVKPAALFSIEKKSFVLSAGEN